MIDTRFHFFILEVLSAGCTDTGGSLVDSPTPTDTPAHTVNAVNVRLQPRAMIEAN